MTKQRNSEPMVNEQLVGFGDSQAKINVYIKHRPPLDAYLSLERFHGLTCGEIADIGKQTGNHWRKIFNVYAKFNYQLEQPDFTCWQDYRDQQLLTADSTTALLFSPPSLALFEHSEASKIHIIMGKTYATKRGISEHCHWLTPEFAIHATLRLIICPYFDYRQLSNIKITQLCQLVKQLTLR